MAAGIKAYVQRRIDEARGILFEELSRGDILPSQAAGRDDLVAAIYHYFRSACMGAARVNLRLLAKGIAGRLRINALIADEFLPHADALASLSRDEIILLASLHRCFAVPDKSAHYKWEAVENELTGYGWDKARVLATAGRALRSGYVFPEANGLGQMVVSIRFLYKPSPLFLNLCQTIDFDDALQREKHAAT